MTLCRLMSEFSESGELHVDGVGDGPVDERFLADSGDTATTLSTIRRYYDSYGYLLDPHTAVGVSVAERHRTDGVPSICLATAHPAKFRDVIEQAVGRPDLARHPRLDALDGMPTRCDVLPASADAVRDYIESRVAEPGA